MVHTFANVVAAVGPRRVSCGEGLRRWGRNGKKKKFIVIHAICIDALDFPLHRRALYRVRCVKIRTLCSETGTETKRSVFRTADP